MTIYVPNWMQGGSYAAHVDRWSGRAETYDEGVLDATAFKVGVRGAGANISVDVSIGDAIVQGDDQALQGNYFVRSDAIVNVPLAAVPGSNSRYDIIILQINDPDAGGAAGSNAVLTKVTGTASGSPVVPAVPNSALLLATIGPITSGTSSIGSGLIADSRSIAGRRCPAGTMELTAAVAAGVPPSGWLYCDGTAVLRSTFARLFAHIGTSYGVGDGSTTFNVPDLRGRTPVAYSAGGTFPTIGATGGEITHVLTTAEMASHTHPIDHDHPKVAALWAAGTPAGYSGASTTGLDLDATFGGSSIDQLQVDLPAFTGSSGSIGSSTAHNNMQPYQVVTGWLIRT